MGETFNPLGRFDPKAPINPGVLDKAKVLYRTLADVDVGGLTRIYLHWTVAPMGMCFADYNVEALIAKASTASPSCCPSTTTLTSSASTEDSPARARDSRTAGSASKTSSTPDARSTTLPPASLSTSRRADRV